MNSEMRIPTPRLRERISNSNNELVIFGTDNFSQFPCRDDSIRSNCDRALPAASNSDLVVLRGEENVIIEPFLDVISTPNDQWVIDTNRTIHHLVHREDSLRKIGLERAR